MSTQAKRLQLAREHAGYKSGRQAALRLGWTYPTYAAHESGWRTYPVKVAKKYAKVFGVSEEWLLFGKQPPSWYTAKEDDLIEVAAPVRYMPFFSTEDYSTIEDILHAEIERRDFCISDLGTLPPHCFAVRVHNDEMAGDPSGIKPGDILVFQMTDEEGDPGSIVILSVKRHTKPAIRRVRSGGGGVKYVTANENYEPLTAGEGRVFGRAVLHVRQM
jgi:SOS-response transcriptional repressor LexA